MHDHEVQKRAGRHTLTDFARGVFEQMPQAWDDDLCNAVAGMGYTELKAFVDWMVARAPAPMPSPKALTPIEVWWLKKLETGVMLKARPGDGWVRKLTTSELTDDYIAAPGYVGVSPSRLGSSMSMGRFLKKVIPTLRKIQVHQPGPPGRIGGGNKALEYHMPTLAVAREFWVEMYGAHVWTQKIVQ